MRPDVTLTPSDHELRGLLTRRIAEIGFAPSCLDLANGLGVDEQSVEASLVRLHDARALLLHPHARIPWVVHPFALSCGSCWVEVGDKGYWANCLYCAFGICAATGGSGMVATRLGGEREPVEYRVREGQVEPRAHVFHLSTPAARWWDNVIFACASFQPFRTTDDVASWCRRHGMARGWTFTIPDLWSFASDWYGGYLQPGWRARSKEEARALFTRHGLTGPFWELPDS